MYATEKIRGVEDALWKALETYADERQYTDKEVRKGIKKTFDKYPLKAAYTAWERKYGGPVMPLPLWWFDFSYNILRRAVREQQKKNPIVINDTNSMYNYVKDLYAGIKAQLEQQQDFYKTDRVEEGDEIRMVELFSECPIIKWILDEQSNEKGRKVQQNQNGKKATGEYDDARKAVNRIFSRLKNFGNE